jgi:pyridoxamine 5'-phosphate oxidase family protein
MALDDASQRYLASRTRGRLATVGPDGVPQNKAVGFVYNAELGAIDMAGFDMGVSAEYRNVGGNANVAFVVDDAVSERRVFASWRSVARPSASGSNRQ